MKFSLAGALLGLVAGGTALVGGPFFLEATSFRALGWLGGGVLLACLLTVTCLLREPRPTGEVPATSLAGVLEVVRRRRVLFFLVGNGAAVAFVTSLTLVTPYLAEALLGRSRGYVGILNAFLFGGMVAGAMLVGVVGKHVSFRHMFAAAMGLGALLVITLATGAASETVRNTQWIWWLVFTAMGCLLLISLVSPPMILSAFADDDGGKREGLFFGLNGMTLNFSNAFSFMAAATMLDMGRTAANPRGVQMVLFLAGGLAAVSALALAGAVFGAARDRRSHPDYQHRAQFDELKPKPVFIIGLHRSGTTFLYKILGEMLPVAVLSVYHIVHFPRLVSQHAAGDTDKARQDLDTHFRQAGMTTRKMDSIPVSHATVEEYGWVLKRYGKTFHFSPSSAPVMDAMCRKLQRLTPGAQAVLLKNPWDTGYVAGLARRYPDARFIFIRRDPTAILNSQFRNAMYYGSTRDPLLNVLLRGIPLARVVMWFQRQHRRFLGEKLFKRNMIRWLVKDVARESERLEQSWQVVEPGRRMGLTYEELVAGPPGVLKQIAEFLEIEPTGDLSTVQAKPRKPELLPEVAAVEAELRKACCPVSRGGS